MNETRYIHSMSYQGRSYTFTKLKQTKDASWYLRLRTRGICIKRRLNTANAMEAEKFAKLVIDATDKGDWAKLDELRFRRKSGALGGKSIMRNQSLMTEDSLKQSMSWVETAKQRAALPGGHPEHAMDALDAALLHTQAASRHIQAMKDLLQKPE